MRVKDIIEEITKQGTSHESEVYVRVFDTDGNLIDSSAVLSIQTERYSSDDVSNEETVYVGVSIEKEAV